MKMWNLQLPMFCNIKDHIKFRQKANVVYRIKCPGCYKNWQKYYNENEHRTKTDKSMYQHFTNCAQFAEYLNYYALADIDVINTTVSK